MTDPLFGNDDAATPLSYEEQEGLIPSYVTLRSELNEIEQTNIGEASLWAFARCRDVLDEAFLRALHKRMFGKVWRWAGQYRVTARNIGIDAHRIGMEVHQLVDDARYWIEHGTYTPDEIAIRFHHRLVFIHPFPNGNGRHARLAADLVAVQLDCPRFSWGSARPEEPGETRARYLAALRAADDHDIGPLMAFARS